jgi:glutaryl-CoA dehydrogenase (non-decarboxylating)
MRIELTSGQLAIQNEVKAFVKEELIPFAGDFDKQGRLPLEIIKKVARMGYLGATVSKEYGGLGLDMISLGLINEQIGRGCSAVRGLLTVHGMVCLAIERWGTEEQKQRWLGKMAKGEIIGAFALTEVGIGSDAGSIETIAIENEDFYIINGIKKWITMGQIADVFLTFVKCNNKTTAILVESTSEGITKVPIGDVMGSRASMLAEIHYKDCKVPRVNLIGKVGVGLSHVAQHSLNYGRYSIAWGCVGSSQACLDASLKYARLRKQFGKALRENQLIQKMIAEMAVEVKASRLLCYNAGYLRDIGDPDSVMETWIAKYYSSITVSKVAGNAIQIHGANGISGAYQVERHYRDAKINEIIEGTSQMHEVLIATNEFRNVEFDSE